MEQKRIRFQRKKTNASRLQGQASRADEQYEEHAPCNLDGGSDIIDEILAGYTSRQTVAGVIGRPGKRSEAAAISSESFVRSFRQESGQ